MTPEKAEEALRYFEEARVVLSTLEERIDEFNKASKSLKDGIQQMEKIEIQIDELGEKISRNINLASIENELKSRVQRLNDIELDIIENQKILRDTRKIFSNTWLNNLLAFALGFVFTFLLKTLNFI
jgi:chromosome segregation ATPase